MPTDKMLVLVAMAALLPSSLADAHRCFYGNGGVWHANKSDGQQWRPYDSRCELQDIITNRGGYCVQWDPELRPACTTKRVLQGTILVLGDSTDCYTFSRGCKALGGNEFVPNCNREFSTLCICNTSTNLSIAWMNIPGQVAFPSVSAPCDRACTACLNPEVNKERYAAMRSCQVCTRLDPTTRIHYIPGMSPPRYIKLLSNFIQSLDQSPQTWLLRTSCCGTWHACESMNQRC